MSRSEDFKVLATTLRGMADLCDVQKDTVAWWTKYGACTHDMMVDFLKCEPPKDGRFREAYTKGQVERGIERSKEKINAGD